MPIYEYRCDDGHQFEVIQSMTDDPVEACEVCGKPVERVFHPIAVHFKGSGFYTTDYARKGAASASSDGASKEAGSGSESKSSSDSGSSKSESKSSDAASSSGSGKTGSGKQGSSD